MFYDALEPMVYSQVQKVGPDLIHKIEPLPALVVSAQRSCTLMYCLY